MSDVSFLNDSGPLPSPLQEAVEAIARTPVDEAAVERVAARAKLLSSTAVSQPAHAEIVSKPIAVRSRNPMKMFAVAASVLVLATAAFLSLDHSAGRAFAEVVQRVASAGSVRFTTTSRFGRGRETSGSMTIQGNRVRFEQFDGSLVEVGDLETRRALFLDMNRKFAQSMELSDSVVKSFANPIERLRSAASSDAESIGQEMLDGRRTDVYRLRKGDVLGMRAPEMMVWVDVESGLPARIVVHNPDPKSETKFELDRFVWNEPLDPQTFALDVPAGFETGVVVKMPQPMSEPDDDDSTAPRIVDGVLQDRVPAVLHWSPDGKTITALMRDPESVTHGRLNDLGQWDIATGARLWKQNVAGAGALAMSADGKLLADVIGYEVQLRDAASGKVVKSWATDESLLPIAFSPDGKTLAAGIAEWGPNGGRGGKAYGGVQLWNIEAGALARSLSDDKPTTFVAWSPDGKHVVSSPNDGPVKLWDAATGKLTRLFPARSRGVFSPDGQHIACISTSTTNSAVGRIDLYKTADASLVRSFTTEKGRDASWLLAVTFSPDGALLAATDWNGAVTVWNAQTGERTQTIPDHHAGVLSAAFSPDGKTLATGGEDKTLRLTKVAAATSAAAPSVE